MAASLFATGRAYETFTSGPETLVAKSPIILVGRVAALSKRVVSTSTPAGPDAIPLKWIVTGRVDNPTALKGSSGSTMVNFSREEQSPFLPPARNGEEWEAEYGDFGEGDSVVLFGGPQHFPAKALPSGVGERDLASLVRDIVSIETGTKGDRQRAWLTYLDDARFDESRKSALRALVQMPIEWKALAPALDHFWDRASLSAGVRAFSFGIVVYGLTQERWKADQVSVADFLVRRFEAEENPKLVLQYVLHLKLALKYSLQGHEKGVLEPVPKRIADALRRREPIVSRMPDIAEQYRQIRATYPGLI